MALYIPHSIFHLARLLYVRPETFGPYCVTFNNCTFCPHYIYVFCIYLRTNSDLCHSQHKVIGFYNRDEVFTARYELDL